jgi:hypothetical protein
MIALRWTIGLLTALLLGHYATGLFVRGLRRHVERGRIQANVGPPAWHEADLVPVWETGTVERLFFTVAVAFGISGAVVAMIAWTAAKMATDWNRPLGERQDPAGAFTALLGGLVSMFFALVGGLICRGAVVAQ